jgi:hypothetical protein
VSDHAVMVAVVAAMVTPMMVTRVRVSGHRAGQ